MSKITGVKATVVSCARNGWATAQVTARAANNDGESVSPGETVAIQAKYGAGRGAKLRCIVVPNSRGGQDWFAIKAEPDVERVSHVAWAPWQVGSQALALGLPSTAPGSDHDGIALACWKCGTDIVGPTEIQRIKDTSVWTNTADLLSGNVTLGKTVYNKYKNCELQQVHCAKCNGQLGSYYATPYFDKDNDSMSTNPFPCFKFCPVREFKSGDKPDMILVLTGDATAVKDSIARLQCSEDWEITKQFAGGGRVDADSWRVREMAIREQTARRDAEAGEAEARAKAAAAAARERVQLEQARRARAEADAAQQREVAAKTRAARLATSGADLQQRLAGMTMQAERGAQDAREAREETARQTSERAAAEARLAEMKLKIGAETVWECEVDGGTWAPYDRALSDRIEVRP